MRKLSTRSQIICFVPAVAVAVYGAATFSGPYKWIARLQMRWWGSYELKMTWLFTLLAVAMVFMPIALMLELREKNERAAGSGGMVRGTVPTGAVESRGEKIAEVFARLQPMLYAPSGKAVLVGVVLLAMGAYSAALGWRAGATVTLAADQEDVASAEHLGKTVVLRGQPVLEADTVWERNHVSEHYVPFVGKSWQPGQPVRVIVTAKGVTAANELRGPKFVGVSNPLGLPGDVREQWQAADAPLAADVLLVELGESSGGQITTGVVLAVVGGLIAMIGYAFYRRRAA